MVVQLKNSIVAKYHKNRQPANTVLSYLKDSLWWIKASPLSIYIKTGIHVTVCFYPIFSQANHASVPQVPLLYHLTIQHYGFSCAFWGCPAPRIPPHTHDTGIASLHHGLAYAFSGKTAEQMFCDGRYIHVASHPDAAAGAVTGLTMWRIPCYRHCMNKAFLHCAHVCELADLRRRQSLYHRHHMCRVFPCYAAAYA